MIKIIKNKTKHYDNMTPCCVTCNAISKGRSVIEMKKLLLGGPYLWINSHSKKSISINKIIKEIYKNYKDWDGRFYFEYAETNQAALLEARQFEKEEPNEIRKVKLNSNGTCYFCGQKGNTIDHIISLCRGGGVKNNLALACRDCNHAKGNLSVDQFRSILLNNIQFFKKRAYYKSLLSKYKEFNGKFHFQRIKVIIIDVEKQLEKEAAEMLASIE